MGGGFAWRKISTRGMNEQARWRLRRSLASRSLVERHCRRGFWEPRQASARSSSNSPWIRQSRKGIRQSNGWLGCREGCSISIISAAASRASTVLAGSGAKASTLAPALRLTDGSSRSLENASSGTVPQVDVILASSLVASLYRRAM